MTQAEADQWRGLVNAVERLVGRPSLINTGRVERLASKAWRIRTPPPWEPEPMTLWRDFARAGKTGDAATLERLLPEAQRRLDALTAPPPAPYYLQD